MDKDAWCAAVYFYIVSETSLACWASVILLGRAPSVNVENAGEGVEKREPFYTVGGNAN